MAKISVYFCRRFTKKSAVGNQQLAVGNPTTGSSLSDSISAGRLGPFSTTGSSLGDSISAGRLGPSFISQVFAAAIALADLDLVFNQSFSPVVVKS